MEYRGCYGLSEICVNYFTQLCEDETFSWSTAAIVRVLPM